MSSAHLFQTVSRDRRTAKWQVRAIEYRGRALIEPAGYARYVGRVGVLAIALGVGSAIAAAPMAFADTTGSAGSTGSAVSDSPSISATSTKMPSRGPSRVVHTGKSLSASSSAVSARGRRSNGAARIAATVGNRLPRRDTADLAGIGAPGIGPDDLIPAMTSSMDGADFDPGAVDPSSLASSPGSSVVVPSLVGAATVSTRRESGVASRTIAASANSVTAAAVGAWQPGAVVRFFVGNGTADDPNAGVLLGNGFSYDASTCPTGSCNGGNGGLVGNGGAGYNGGSGGSAGAAGSRVAVASVAVTAPRVRSARLSPPAATAGLAGRVLLARPRLVVSPGPAKAPPPPTPGLR